MYTQLIELSRFKKSMILLAVDTLLVVVCVYLAYALRLSTIAPFDVMGRAIAVFPVFLVLAPFVIWFTGLHRFKLSTFEGRAITRTAKCALFLVAVLTLLNMGLGYKVPRTVPVIFGVLFFVGSVGSRLMGQWFMSVLHDNQFTKKRVLIYGAGDAGTQLAFALQQQQTTKVVAFVDDKRALEGMIVAGLRVVSPQYLETMVKAHSIDRIILAMPSAQGVRRAELVTHLSKFDCDVQVLPSFDELLDGRDLVENLRPVSPDDLLGRESVDLDLPVVRDTYAEKVVLVTGAGGSIGSELCRQLMACNIAKLVIMDHAEYNLYAIENELKTIAQERDIALVPILGSVTDEKLTAGIMADQQVQIVLHAAAYKHVPMVETNEISGLINNVIGTRVIANAARQAKIERFILISTDKAVRPTNIMGASKRLAELVIQDFAARSDKTLFSMVRFGNVLGSSGSVIPLFRKQIENGGPVTVTHKDVTRFFMTIPEATRLVLLCGSFARGGDVFVLDMGKPMKIVDMAKMMIELSGRSVKDESNPDGDIEIEVVGLRPGEKLYEELLIGDDMLTTPHPKILRAQETSLSELEIANMLRDITSAFEDADRAGARALVARWVDGYKPPLEATK